MSKVYVYPQDNGTYKCQWRDPITKRQRSLTVPTKEEANEFAVLTEADMIKGIYRDDTKGKMPLIQFVEDEYFPEKKLGAKARAGYSRYWRVNLKPFFEQERPGIELRQVQADTAIKWSLWAEKRFQPSTVKEAYVVWRSIMTYASETKGYIPANTIRHLAKQVVPDQNESREKTILNPQQLVALSNAIQPRFKAMVMLMGVVGLRPGEAIGLRMEDLHLTEGYITVRRSVVTVDGKMVENHQTKNKKVRRVYLPPPLVESLIEHIMTFVADSTDDSLVFCQERKKGFIHTSQLRNNIVEAGEKIGKKLTTYDLRHTATVNAMRASQNDAEFTSKMLGNTVQVMMNNYNHLTEESVVSNVDKLAQMYS